RPSPMASQTLTSGRSIEAGTGDVFLVKDAVDLRIGQGGNRLPCRWSEDGELGFLPGDWRGGLRGLLEALSHEAGDEIFQLHAVECGPGLGLAKQLIWEFDCGSHGAHFYAFVRRCQLPTRLERGDGSFYPAGSPQQLRRSPWSTRHGTTGKTTRSL